MKLKLSALPRGFVRVLSACLPQNRRKEAENSRGNQSEPPLLFENRAVAASLRGIIHHLPGHRGWEEDLMQEARIHLWQTELAKPGQTISWYVQSCRFHLQDFLRREYHVDCPKQPPTGPLRDEEDDANDVGGDKIEIAEDQDVLSNVGAREIIALLVPRLNGLTLRTFLDLVDGQRIEDIAQKLECSHQKVSRCRLNIAKTARCVGIRPIGE